MAPASTPTIIPAADSFEALRGVFSSGGAAAYPTETFYGIAVDPFNEAAVKKLLELKKRPPEKPVTLIIGNEAMLSMVAAGIPSAAKALMKKFWPGPLTIIFKAKGLPSILTAGTGTVGVRLSGLNAARRLSLTLSSPVTATSANPSDMPPARSVAEVLDYFNGNIAAVIDGGALEESLPSTIVDASADKGTEIKIIREGKIPASEIAGCLSKEEL